MYVTLKRLWYVKLMPKDKMKEAVRLKWITEEQYEEIVGEKYVPAGQEETQEVTEEVTKEDETEQSE